MNPEEQDRKDYEEYQLYLQYLREKQQAESGSIEPVTVQVDNGPSLRNLTNPQNWKDLGAGVLQTLGSLGQIGASVNPFFPSLPEELQPQTQSAELIQALGGDVNTPVAAAGRQIGGAVIPTGGPVATALQTGASAIGAGVGYEKLGPLGELIGSLAPALIQGGARYGLNKMSERANQAKYLEQPNVQQALQYAETKGYIPDASAVKKITPEIQDKLDLVSEKAANLPQMIKSELEVEGGATNVYRKLGGEWARHKDTILDSDVFKSAQASGASIDDLASSAASKLDEINISRQTAVKDLMEEAPKSLKFIDRDAVAKEVTEFGKRISTLKKSSMATDEAAGMEETAKKILSDFSRQKISIEDAVEMNHTLNWVRRNIEQEFNASKMGAVAKGDVPSSGKMDGSIKAVRELQKAIKEAVGGRIAEINKTTGKSFDTKLFHKLDDEYGAMSTLEDIATEFAAKTQKLISEEGTATVFQSEKSRGLFNPFSRRDWINKLVKELQNPQQAIPAADRARMNMARIDKPLQNIQILQELSASPLQQYQKAPEVGGQLMPEGYQGIIRALLAAQGAQ